jgi:hypothetical protein
LADQTYQYIFLLRGPADSGGVNPSREWYPPSYGNCTYGSESPRIKEDLDSCLYDIGWQVFCAPDQEPGLELRKEEYVCTVRGAVRSRVDGSNAIG